VYDGLRVVLIFDLAKTKAMLEQENSIKKLEEEKII